MLLGLAALFAAGEAKAQPLIVCDLRGCSDANAAQRSELSARGRARATRAYNSTIVGGRPSGCPRLYCGCATSLKVFGRIIPKLNLAINWARTFPRARPAAGMVAARNGHVFFIKEYLGDGTALVYDPNSGGGKTRIHIRSLAGYTVVDPHGSRMARL